MMIILLSLLYFISLIAKSTMRSPLIKSKQSPIIALVLSNRRSLLLEDADYDGHLLSMFQKIAGALNQKVEIKFSAIAS
jgi:hypothetical protein